MIKSNLSSSLLREKSLISINFSKTFSDLILLSFMLILLKFIAVGLISRPVQLKSGLFFKIDRNRTPDPIPISRKLFLFFNLFLCIFSNLSFQYLEPNQLSFLSLVLELKHLVYKLFSTSQNTSISLYIEQELI